METFFLKFEAGSVQVADTIDMAKRQAAEGLKRASVEEIMRHIHD